LGSVPTLTVRDYDMSMTMAVVDRAALEQLRAARTEDADVQAAVATLERALKGSEGRTLLTTTEAADALGVRSVHIVKYWVKTGYIHGVKHDERTMIPVSEVERIMDEDHVRDMRAADKLDEATNELGRPMTDEEMEILAASRPGKLPWK